MLGLFQRRDVGQAHVVAAAGLLGLHAQPAVTGGLFQAPDEVGFLEVVQFLPDAVGQFGREGCVERSQGIDVHAVQRGGIVPYLGAGSRADPAVDATGRHVEQPYRHLVVAFDVAGPVERQQPDGNGLVGGLIASQRIHGGRLRAQLARTLGRQIADHGGGGVHHRQQRGGLQVQPGQRRLQEAQQIQQRVERRQTVQNRGAQIPDGHQRHPVPQVDHGQPGHGGDDGRPHHIQQGLEDFRRQQARDDQRKHRQNRHGMQPGPETVPRQPRLHQPPHQGRAGAGEGHLRHLLQPRAQHAGGRRAQPVLQIAPGRQQIERPPPQPVGQQPYHPDVHQLAGHEGRQPQQHQNAAQHGALRLDLALRFHEALAIPQIQRQRGRGAGQLQPQHQRQVMLPGKRRARPAAAGAARAA